MSCVRLFSLFICCGFLGAQATANEKPKAKPTFTIGKDTTRILGPLDKDGRIDYETALNEILSKGVTPENNAVVLLFQAFGPHPEKAKIPGEFFKWLQIGPPPEKGDYFVRDLGFAHLRFNKDDKDIDKFLEQVVIALYRPWTAMEYPDVAAWIQHNEKPLVVAINASKRSHYFYPILGHRNKVGGSDGLFTAQIAGISSCRYLTSALTARAMMRVAEKRCDEAWQDLMACHRLGRLVARGGTIMEALGAYNIDHRTSKAQLKFLEAAKLDAKKIKACLRDLQELPPMPSLASKVDLCERFWALETVMNVDRDGAIRIFKLSVAGHEMDWTTRIFDLWLTAWVKWDPSLRDINEIYDRLAAAMRNRDLSKRKDELREIDNAFVKRRVYLLNSKEIASNILNAKTLGEGKGKYLGDLIISFCMPPVQKALESSDRVEQVQRNLHVAFALAAYKADEGRYPKSLDALAPKYLKTVPDDLFSGKSLIYRLDGNGYLLYSVGVNGKDDCGRTADDDPRGDDLAVRMRN
jgi:hypothetical protein